MWTNIATKALTATNPSQEANDVPDLAHRRARQPDESDSRHQEAEQVLLLSPPDHETGGQEAPADRQRQRGGQPGVPDVAARDKEEGGDPDDRPERPEKRRALAPAAPSRGREPPA